MREDRVKIKLNPISQALKGKSVVVVDDPGAAPPAPHRRLIATPARGDSHAHLPPPFMHFCYYGTDIGSRDAHRLPAHAREIRKIIGADTLGYLPLTLRI